MSTTLAENISKAALAVGGKLEADKTNFEQRYDYISADKILSECGQALFSQGIAVLPLIDAYENKLFEYTDQNGKARRRYDAQVSFTFRITNGYETTELKWFGCGSDYTVPDKALYKAITSGHKYFLMKLLCIGAGNEDGENETPEVEKPTSKAASKADPKTGEIPVNGKHAVTKAEYWEIVSKPPYSWTAEQAGETAKKYENDYTKALDAAKATLPPAK